MKLLVLVAFAAGFHGSIQPVSKLGPSWHPGCPVSVSQLWVLTVSHWGFDGRVHSGRLVVNADAATPLLTVFRRLYALRFPIRRMVPVDAYGADDYRSIEADNTSAFNCRRATASTHWSEHAYGEAVDLDPLENPYVDSGRTSHPRSVPYLDRSRLRPGMVPPAVIAAFRSIGWGWGGDWTGSVRDYQHFLRSGR